VGLSATQQRVAGVGPCPRSGRHVRTIGTRHPIEIDGDHPSPVVRRSAGASSLAGNLLLAALYGSFAAVHLAIARRTGQWAPILPLVAQEALLVVLFLTRRRTLASSTRLTDWGIGIVGTYLPLFLRATGEISPLGTWGAALQMAGLTLGAMGAASLGRSLGIIAANRGIKTSGLYRVLRHPMYASHLLGYFGYLACYPTVQNCTIVAVTLIALCERARVEERLLAADPAYRAYARRVRWRLVPYLF
jgi:protein-S-isoprenylcysteine O-methyltransferase Ste14